MRILFASHTGSVGGAESALLNLLDSLVADHEVAAACPAESRLSSALARAGIAWSPLPAFEASFRPHPVHTPAGLAALGPGAIALARMSRRFRAEVICANSPRAGLIGGLATQFGGAPLVVRVHDHFPPNFLGRGVRSIIARSAAEVVAVSDYTAARFNDGLRAPVATRVYNGFDQARFDPDRVSPAPLRDELGIAPHATLLGHVAQITPWKAQDDGIRAVADLRRGGIDAHLVIVGEITFAAKQVRYDNASYLTALHSLVDELALRDAVHFLGRREDVPAVFAALDISLLPSWDDPFPLGVLESLAMGTPAFVTTAGGAAEAVKDGVAGRVLPPKRPRVWADAVRQALSEPDALERMGIRGRDAATGFSKAAHARSMLAVFERAARCSNRRHAHKRVGGPQRRETEHVS